MRTRPHDRDVYRSVYKPQAEGRFPVQEPALSLVAGAGFEPAASGVMSSPLVVSGIAHTIEYGSLSSMLGYHSSHRVSGIRGRLSMSWLPFWLTKPPTSGPGKNAATLVRVSAPSVAAQSFAPAPTPGQEIREGRDIGTLSSWPPRRHQRRSGAYRTRAWCMATQKVAHDWQDELMISLDASPTVDEQFPVVAVRAELVLANIGLFRYVRD
jgi:hypothetical protein